MRLTQLLLAVSLGLASALVAVPGIAPAETLRVMRGETASILRVPMNRAVVVESDAVFAELSVANPLIADIATLSDRTIYVLGKAPGRTTLTLLGPDGRLITNVEVQVTPDIEEFKERLAQIMPGENIEVRTANDGIVLSGTVSSITRLDRAIELANRYAPDRVSNMMSVGGTQQVMLKVRFAEVERSVSKALNASLGITVDTPPGGGDGLLTGTGALAAPNNINTTVNGGVLGGSLDNRTGGFNLNFGASPVQVGILLEALENRGVVRTLAEPNLTSLSGQEASFLAGGEFPVPISDGNGGLTIDYKPIGANLAFTPTVLEDEVINLELLASVSSVASTAATNNGIPVFTFNNRQAQTTVQLRDGQSFAIAGLLEDDFRSTKGQVPWLGDIPVIGTLFRSSSFQREQSELVIIITAHLVTPTTGEALTLPTDRLTLPSERDFFLNGTMAQGNRPQQGAVGEVARQDFAAPYGYVLE